MFFDQGIMKTLVYYTDNHIDEELRIAVARQLLHASGGLPIISVSHKPIDLGRNVVVGKLGRSDLSIFKQIVIGALLADDIVFLIEHDVLYHPSHFDFTPKQHDTLYYNNNKWHLRLSDGKASYWESPNISMRSQIVAHKNILIEHYGKAIVGNTKSVHKETFFSECPNIDIRHQDNFTKPDDMFRPKKHRKNFRLSSEIPCWGEIELKTK